jgi:hypothetical protein
MTVGIRSAWFGQRVGGRHPTGEVRWHRTYRRLRGDRD